MTDLFVRDVVSFLEQLAPLSLAEDWDNTGLLLGREDQLVRRIMTCLTITPEVVSEARDSGVSLLVSHHPILFRPVQKITSQDAQGAMVMDLMQSEMAVYSPHTAYDSSERGINQQLAERLQLHDIRPLRAHPAVTPEKSEYKLVVFTPHSHTETVAASLFEAGAGKIGEYSECSFHVAGTGTFLGSPNTQPVFGEKGSQQKIPEDRLEVRCPKSLISTILATMHQHHPYEEPAFDLYPLAQNPYPDQRTGAGRLGNFDKPLPLSELIARIKDQLGVSPIGLVGDPQSRVTRLGVACGAAGEFLTDAVQAECDAFLTGETRFHTFLDARTHGITLLMAGHYASERFALEQLATWLNEAFPDLTVSPSQNEKDPLRWL